MFPILTPPTECWSRAMWHCADAANATYWAMAQQAMSFWTQAATSMMPDAARARPVDSWYRPERPVRNALLPTDPSAVAAMWGFPRADGYQAFGGAPMSPFAIWLSMFPLRGPPASWPFAFAMIASGMPSNVAWPTAEANAALLNAADAARETMQEMFASYQTSSGHATSVPRTRRWLN